MANEECASQPDGDFSSYTLHIVIHVIWGHPKSGLSRVWFQEQMSLWKLFTYQQPFSVTFIQSGCKYEKRKHSPVCRSLPAVTNTSIHILKQVFLETSSKACAAAGTSCPFRCCCLVYIFLIITLPASSEILWRSFFLWSWRMDLNFIEGLPELQDVVYGTLLHLVLPLKPV